MNDEEKNNELDPASEGAPENLPPAEATESTEPAAPSDAAPSASPSAPPPPPDVPPEPSDADAPSSSLPTAPPPPPPETPEAPEAPEAPTDPAAEVDIPAAEIEEGKNMAMLSYIPLVFIYTLIKRDNAFSLFHAKQLLMLNIVGVAGMVVQIIPCLGQLISLGLSVALIVFWVMGLINAINGVAKPLPVVGQYAVDWFKGLTKIGE